MKKKPYIGITGFMSSEEVDMVLRNTNLKDAGRLFMVGVLVSSKTMQGITNKWPNRYPEFGEIKNIFPDNENCLNLVHFNTKEPTELLSQLVQITDEAGPFMNGFQLNISWPSLKALDEYQDLCPGKSIVLQIGKHAFDEVCNDLSSLAKKVEDYIGLIDYVLLDPSGGLGQPFDPKIVRDYLYELGKFENELGLGVAGGLSPTTLDLVEYLVKDYPDLSIDAEGKLRTTEDHFDVEVGRQYLQQALQIFSTKK